METAGCMPAVEPVGPLHVISAPERRSTGLARVYIFCGGDPG